MRLFEVKWVEKFFLNSPPTQSVDIDKFLIKKQKRDDDDDESGMASTSVGSNTPSSVSSKTVTGQYNEDYLSFGFIPSGEELPCP